MNKRFRFALVIFSFFFLFFPRFTYAHFAENDGNMTVTLHVDPNDDPTPGKQANLYFLFNDISKKFKLSNCKCIVTITDGGKQVIQNSLVERKSQHFSVWGTFMPFVFPQKGLYHIALTGTPLIPNSFQPFSVSWDFRADPANPGIVDDDQPSNPPSHIPDIQVLLSALVVVIIGVVLLAVFFKKQILEHDTN